MIVYGINYSTQVENNKGKLAASVGVPVGAVMGTCVGSRFIGFTIPTDGLSLLWGAVSAGLAGVGSAVVVKEADSVADGETNNGKGSTIKLINEMSESDSKLGKKFDWEAEKYENKYLQEVPPKESCRIM